VRLSRRELVAGTTRVAVDGLIYAAAAAALDLTAHPLDAVYHDGPHVSPDELVTLDQVHVQVVEDALARGDAALRTFSPSTEPILWPEHFDIAITLDEVNYGVSPGDAFHERPYAYVGPHGPRSGAFWNAPFGAARSLDDFSDVSSVVEFFRDGAAAAEG
jgi:hypothetical protein